MRNNRRRILILGGTSEARKLAIQVVKTLPNHVEIISSYAGKTIRTEEPPGTIREGGFGGAKGLEDFIRSESIDLLIDATHPFATVISNHAAVATEAIGCPRLVLRRPDWKLSADIQVREAKNMDEAAHWLSGRKERVFLSTGRHQLNAFTHLKEAWFLIRLITMSDFPLPLSCYKIVTGRPPFKRESEISLLKQNGIQCLVSKHSGGPVPEKVAAAGALGIPIILIRQPEPPTGRTTNEISKALTWIQAIL